MVTICRLTSFRHLKLKTGKIHKCLWISKEYVFDAANHIADSDVLVCTTHVFQAPLGPPQSYSVLISWNISTWYRKNMFNTENFRQQMTTWQQMTTLFTVFVFVWWMGWTSGGTGEGLLLLVTAKVYQERSGEVQGIISYCVWPKQKSKQTATKSIIKLAFNYIT